MSHQHQHNHNHNHIGHNGTAVQAIRFAAGLILSAIAMFLKGNVQIYLFLAGYIVLGFEVILTAIKNLFKKQVFDENFLMSIASAGAFIIGEYREAVAVMLFYLVGEFFQDLAVSKSRKSITDLMDIRPDYANIPADSGLKRVAPETVKPGDIIVVKAGEKIPLDGVVTEGEASLDMRALSGEPKPKRVKPLDEVISGSVNLNGVLTITVTKSFSDSTVAKIIDLVENESNKKAPTENFITTFSKYYTPAVTGLALLTAVIPPLLFNGSWADWIHRALVFLVISCPCALVISVPLGFFGGIGGASRKGVLIKGGGCMEALGSIDIAVFDKTGTLTRGVFKVKELYPAEGYTESGLLELAARTEALSNHPIAVSVMKAYGKNIDKSKITDYREMTGLGISVKADDKRILAGNGKLMEKENIVYSEIKGAGTKVYIAANNKFAGGMLISDEVKPDSRAAVEGLKKLGVRKTVMLTGDDVAAAESVAAELSLDEVYARLLPADKVERLEALEKQKSAKGKLAFTGDGINDAPVLARADLGIAMGGLGSDAAIEAADVVLMTDEPSKLIDAVKIAKRTKRIVMQNIVFALGVKAAFLALGALGVSGMWEAVFADIGVSVLAVLNSLRAMRI